MLRRVVQRRIRPLAIAIVFLAICIVELWFGEDSSNPFPRLWWAALAGTGATAAVWRIAGSLSLRQRTFATIACAAVSAASFLIGDREMTRAYNECVEHGEEIRNA